MENVITIRVELSGLEKLAEAISRLAGAPAGIAGGTPPVESRPVPLIAGRPVMASAPSRPAVQPSVQQPSVQQPPVQQPPAPQQAPVQPSVATSQTAYTLDDLARAGMTLMDTGRQGDLQQLLARFGVEALPALPPAQYGAFATALREMGAQI